MNRILGSVAAFLVAASAALTGVVPPAPSQGTRTVYLPLVNHPLNADLAFEVREAVFNSIDSHIAAMSDLDSLEERTALADYIRTLAHIEAAGIESDGSVWGRFTDGRLYILAPTPRPGQTTLTRNLSPDLPALTPVAGGNTTDKAFIMTAMGPCFNRSGYVSPTAEIAGWLQARNYQVSTDLPTVDFLKANIQDASILHIEGHGGVGTTEFYTTYGVWTATDFTRANESKYREDLENGRLVYMSGTYDGYDTKSGKCLKLKRRYAFTYGFVSTYMSFKPRSLVVLGACSSASNDARLMRQSLATQGASLLIGWSDATLGSDIYRLNRFLYDRLLGANAFMPETPPQRPFDIGSVYQDLARRGIDVSRWCRVEFDPQTQSCPDHQKVISTLKLLPSDDETRRFLTLVPSLRSIGADVTGDPSRPVTFRLFGIFGPDSGQVTVNGQAAQVLAWSPVEITARLPMRGPGSAGDVVISVNGHPGNAVPLTEWRGRADWREDDSAAVADLPGFGASGSCELVFRADLHAGRDEIAQPPAQPATTFDLPNGDEFTCNWEMYGEGTATIGSPPFERSIAYTLTGQGQLNWQNSSVWVKVDLPSRRMVLTIQPVPGAPGTYGYLVGRDLTTGVVMTDTAGLFIGGVQASLSMDDGFDVSAGTHTQDNVVLSWTSLPVRYLPDQQTPARTRSGTP